jgi:hypothetical protein
MISRVSRPIALKTTIHKIYFYWHVFHLCLPECVAILPMGALVVVSLAFTDIAYPPCVISSGSVVQGSTWLHSACVRFAVCPCVTLWPLEPLVIRFTSFPGPFSEVAYLFVPLFTFLCPIHWSWALFCHFLRYGPSCSHWTFQLFLYFHKNIAISHGLFRTFSTSSSYRCDLVGGLSLSFASAPAVLIRVSLAGLLELMLNELYRHDRPCLLRLPGWVESCTLLGCSLLPSVSPQHMGTSLSLISLAVAFLQGGVCQCSMSVA